ncbi:MULTISPECIES: tyramine oxidase subunit B [Anaerostipes]|uniref:tyramine oxidase subunit B n=1 Tax=Anaerostipes TaxID=207244 RepID=UPI002587FEBB|nr:tyramine oxidase subunit B [Anaerostipes sp.]MCI5624216.1 tyramine oxidase subunit B [Anaerostipes sp.]
MSDARIDFLYLNEQDMIKAGVLDAGKCVDVMEEVVSLLGKGDYLMGGPDHNAHGLMLEFPKESDIEDFPLQDSRDRRFIAMPAYLGGRFHVAGQKWYGSNGRNRAKGYPRSILMATLNDVETGAPISYMSANLLSSMRTGAMPGLVAKHFAKKDATTVGIIGPGVINRSSMRAFAAKFPTIHTVKMVGSSPNSKTAMKMKEFIEEHFPEITTIEICATVQEAVKDADIVCEAASVTYPNWPELKYEWLKPGAVVVSTNGLNISWEDEKKFSKVVDNWGMYEEYAQEDGDDFYPDGTRKNCGTIGEDFVFMVRDGMIKREDVKNLADIVNGECKGRTSEDEIFLVSIEGMPIQDVAWAYECYHQAKKKGIGTMLNLWEEPVAF